MSVFSKRTRVMFLKPIAFGASETFPHGEAFARGDVAELPSDQARGFIAAAIAEATVAPVGRVVPPLELRRCPWCDFVGVNSPRCECCGVPLG
jgi:hypothetical protein